MVAPFFVMLSESIYRKLLLTAIPLCKIGEIGDFVVKVLHFWSDFKIFQRKI